MIYKWWDRVISDPILYDYVNSDSEFCTIWSHDMIYLVYESSYQIKEEIRPNAYLIEDLDERTIGVYNSRQLKPHKDPQYKEIGCIQSASDKGYITDASQNSTDTVDTTTLSSSSAESEKEESKLKTKPILKKTRENSEQMPEKGKRIKKVRINRKPEYSPDERSSDDKGPKVTWFNEDPTMNGDPHGRKIDGDLKQKKDKVSKKKRSSRDTYRDIYVNDSDDELI